MAATLKNTESVIPANTPATQDMDEAPNYVLQKTDAMTNPVVVIVSLILLLVILSIVWTPFVLMIFYISAAFGMLFMLMYMAIWPIILDIFRPGSFDD